MSNTHVKPSQDDIDTALDHSFPASDPPSWVMGREPEALQDHPYPARAGSRSAPSGRTEPPALPLRGKTVAILATHGFEQSELVEPKKALEEQGARTEIVSLESGTIRGWTARNWGQDVPVDVPIKIAQAERYDALVLPGGVMNPDRLRLEPRAVDFVRAFFNAGKPIAAICHAPWLLVEAGIVRGARLTSWPSLRTDIRNAGGDWVDKDVVSDKKLVTSRKPEDLPAFKRKMLELFTQAENRKVQIGPTDVS